MHHTVIAVVEDRPGVLNRAVSLFRRRGLNIESLTVGATEHADFSRITVVVDEARVPHVLRQLDRLVEVLAVRDVTGEGAVQQEMCLVRVTAHSDRLGELVTIAREFGARIVGLTPTAMMLALMDEPTSITSLADRLRDYGIEELTRSGRIAMSLTKPQPVQSNGQGAPAPRSARPAPEPTPFHWQADGIQ